MPEILTQIDERLLWWLASLSLVLFVGTLAVVPWLVARIPPDYFVLERRGRRVLFADRPLLRMIALAIGNVLGVILILAGIAMLVLPGQGILTIVMGILLSSFPGKYRLERWIVSFQTVRRMIDVLRRRAGREPLLFLDEIDPGPGDDGPQLP